MFGHVNNPNSLDRTAQMRLAKYTGTQDLLHNLVADMVEE